MGILNFDNEDEFEGEEDRIFTVELYVYNYNDEWGGRGDNQITIEETLLNIEYVEPLVMHVESNQGHMLRGNQEYIVFVDTDGNEFQRVLSRYPKINYLVQKNGKIEVN